MYEKILLPTDSGQGMGQVIDHGLDLARKYGATVHALYVIDARILLVLPEEAQSGVKSALQAEGDRATDAITTQASNPDVEIIQVTLEGFPHQVILEYAASHDIDLIVMGTHGRTGSEQDMLGSVAESTVRLSPIPIHVIPIDITEPRPPERGVM